MTNNQLKKAVISECFATYLKYELKHIPDSIVFADKK